MSGKSSPLEFLSMSVLKRVSGTFSHIIARLANLSFVNLHFPGDIQDRSSHPTVEEVWTRWIGPGELQTDIQSQYSKILERLFLARILSQVTSSPNYNPLHWRHSTKTALLNLVIDIYGAIDSSQSTLMIALDMSTVFNTIDHNIMISWLQRTSGIHGMALGWPLDYTWTVEFQPICDD